MDTHSRIEALESRIAPAVVAVDFTDGILNLTGATDDHKFAIEAIDATTFQLRAMPETTFLLQGAVTPTSLLRLSGAIEGITGSFGAGIDDIDIDRVTVA